MKDKYIIGVDPYIRLKWWQTLFKYIGLFHKDKSKSGCIIYKINNDTGIIEIIKN